MKTQISRVSYDANRRYSGVYQQQGRMLTDADWNELMTIVKQRLDDVLKDAIKNGAPRDRGLKILDHDQIQPGYLYVDGIVAQIPGDSPIVFTDQPDFPGAPNLPSSGYVLYADSWERPIVSLEDGGLRDAGLHGADTCTRTRTMLQIKWCDTSIDIDDDTVNPSRGNAPLTLTLWRGTNRSDNCDPCAFMVPLDTRVGNYLFRVEVHDVGNASNGNQQLWLKWSSENGAEQHQFGNVPDGFGVGGWVFELYNDSSEQHLGVHLAEGFLPVRGDLKTTLPSSASDGFDKVRRWDGYCVLERDSAGIWTLVKGSDRGKLLSSGLDEEVHGHVSFTDGMRVNLTALVMKLDLDGRRFVSGDYWLATVREAVDKPGTDLLMGVEPHGIVHHYLKLATVGSNGSVTDYSDAERRQFSFPALNDIQAKDVGFQDPCSKVYEGAENVQQAFEKLCDNLDIFEQLRKHHKYLHGWGVVCGLKVTCTKDRNTVKLSSGYAVDCEGYTLFWPDDASDVPTEKLLAELDSEVTEGEYCLSMSRSPAGAILFHLDPAEKPTTWNLILDGTLLGKIKEQCIDPLLAMLSKFQGEPHQISWALLDLFWPAFGNGLERPFITPQEHGILERLYKQLSDHLSSPTHCTLKSEAEAFPDYPFLQAPRIEGQVFEERAEKLRVRPDARKTYLFSDAKPVIQVLDVETMTVDDSINFGEKNVTGVIDMTFGPDSRFAIVAAVVGEGGSRRYCLYKSSDIDSGVFENWLATEKEIVEIRLVPGIPEILYVLVRNEGLFKISLVEGTFPDEPFYEFPAQGGLKITEDARFAYAAALNPDEGITYIFGFHLAETDEDPSFLRLKLGESYILDDFEVIYGHKIYVIAGESRSGVTLKDKELRIYLAEKKYEDPTVMTLGSGQVCIALSPEQDRLILSRGQYTKVSGIWWLDVTTDEWHPNRFIPAQLLPQALEIVRDQVFVFNKQSRSVLNIPEQLIGALKTVEHAARYRDMLESYRDDIVETYLTLAQLFVKALLDCCCHQLLVDCPECGESPHKVPLACMVFKDRKVERICNLGHRKYVLSFPTLAYWLSMVPLLPWLKAQFAKFCCMEDVPFLQQLFIKEPVEKSNFIKTVPYVVAEGSKHSIAKALPNQISRYSATKIDQIIGRITRAQTEEPLGAEIDVIGKRSDDVKVMFKDRNVTVEKVVKLEKDSMPKGVKMVDIAAAPLTLKRGDRVILYERDDKVMFYGPVVKEDEAAVGVSDETKAELKALEERKEKLRDMSAVRAELAKVESRRADVMNLVDAKSELAALNEEKESMQKTLTELKTDLALVKSEQDKVAEVRTQLAELKAEHKALERASEAEAVKLAELESRRQAITEGVEELKSGVEAIEKRHKELRVDIAKERPVREVERVTEEIDNILRELGIRSVGELAKEKARRLIDAGISEDTAIFIIRTANARIRL